MFNYVCFGVHGRRCGHYILGILFFCPNVKLFFRCPRAVVWALPGILLFGPIVAFGKGDGGVHVARRLKIFHL